MSPFQLQSEFYNQPVRLTEEQQENPVNVLDEFFTDYSLSEVRDMLNTNSEVCLTSDVHPYDVGEGRANLIYFQQKMELLLEAAFVISNKHRKDD
jgi:fido (protein-threonine AMPylation protein)